MVTQDVDVAGGNLERMDRYERRWKIKEEVEGGWKRRGHPAGTLTHLNLTVIDGL